MISWERVRELHDEIGDTHFRVVLEIFLDEVDEAIANLDPTMDLQSLAAAMHFLKGSALNVGFRALSDSCSRAEKLALEGHASKIEFVQILATYETSRDEFLRSFPAILSAA